MNGTSTNRPAVVVDSSFVVDLLAAVPGVAKRASQLGDVQFHAPQLIDLEFASSLRSNVFAGKMSSAEAARMFDRFFAIPLVFHSHRPFLSRIWQLRNNVSTYDAAYVALAEFLNVPLLTRDARLARSAGHTARVEYID